MLSHPNESHNGGKRRASARRWFDLEPPAPERLPLETTPRVSTVASYVFTHAAERSWQVLNQHLAEPQGAVFWIGGPAGCGKTHFLDYVIALQRRAGALDAQNIRRLVCGLELAGPMSAAEVELLLLSVLADEIGGNPRSSGDLFRQMRGAAALNVGLETARRTGVRAVTVAIDFATSQCEAVADFFKVLAQVAASFSQVKFTVIAAGRAKAPQAARALAVAPRDAGEETTVAIRRARRLVEDADLDPAVAYAGIDTAGLAAVPIQPV
jgi:ABC-type cobalamin/Fe3+-siderophores transport system ATPase subunit